MPTLLRQHSETSIPELRGRDCTGFLAVLNCGHVGVGACYVKLDDVWHQFVIDTKVLRWEVGLGPDPKDDLWTDDDEYIDLMAKYCLKGPVGLIEMTNSILLVPIGDTVLRFVYTPDEDTLIEVVDNE